jgi:hypothetical protein
MAKNGTRKVRNNLPKLELRIRIKECMQELPDGLAAASCSSLGELGRNKNKILQLSNLPTSPRYPYLLTSSKLMVTTE